MKKAAGPLYEVGLSVVPNDCVL